MSEVNKATDTTEKVAEQASTKGQIDKQAPEQVEPEKITNAWLYRVGQAHQSVWQNGMNLYLIVGLVFLIVEIGYDFPTRLNAFHWLNNLPVMADSFMAYVQKEPLIILGIIAINVIMMLFSVLAAFGRSAENIAKEVDHKLAKKTYQTIVSYEKGFAIIQGFVQLILVVLGAVIFLDQRIPMVHNALAIKLMSNISLYNISLFAIPVTIAIGYGVFVDNMSTGKIAKKKGTDTEDQDKEDIKIKNDSHVDKTDGADFQRNSSSVTNHQHYSKCDFTFDDDDDDDDILL